MLNVTECCKTMGCNCGGTANIETINNLLDFCSNPYIKSITLFLAIIGLASILYFIQYCIPRK
jgi:hypothetical protein